MGLIDAMAKLKAYQLRWRGDSFYQELIQLAENAGEGFRVKKLFDLTLPELINELQERRLLATHWDGLFQIGVASQGKGGALFQALNLKRDLFFGHWRPYWQTIVDLGVAAGRDNFELFFNLPKLERAIGSEASLKSVGEYLIGLGRCVPGEKDEFFWSIVWLWDIQGKTKGEYGEKSLRRVGDEFVKIGRVIDFSPKLLEGIGTAGTMWGRGNGHPEEMLMTVQRLYGRHPLEEQPKVIKRFIEIMEQSSPHRDSHPGFEEFLRERFIQIANRNFVNHTPQFVLPELDKFSFENKRVLWGG
jgi:hypothetical protein